MTFAAHVTLTPSLVVVLHIPNNPTFLTFFRNIAEATIEVILITVVIEECLGTMMA
ncbi:unnamed protein product [Meloidogyne enterolobii]|uniref:Uncharacterized protein n=1 Tax=Meloidogyne enterolobii TaxID=390850 RepID=A0ACB0Z643_MELEN